MYLVVWFVLVYLKEFLAYWVLFPVKINNKGMFAFAFLLVWHSVDILFWRAFFFINY